MGALVALVIVAAATVASAQALQPVPALRARVTDLTGTLSPEQSAALEKKLAAFEERRGAQVVLLIVPTTRPEEIEQFSIRVVEQWKIGREKPDDGVLLLVAKEDRRLRIEVGRGLEGALTDLASKRIISETVVPRFRAGDLYGGVDAGIDRILAVVDGEPLPPPAPEWEGGAGPELAPLLPVLVMAVLVLAPLLRGVFGHGLGSLLTGGAAGGLVYWISRILGLSLLAAGLGFAIALLFGGGGRRGWSSRARHGGWGAGWGGGFGGSGGGGFGGGGGSFGGGGASGSW